MSVSIEGVSPSSILVNVEPPEVGPSIEFFKASVKGGLAAQRCIERASTNPVKCRIDHLTRGKTPTVEVKSCVPGNDACSSAVEKVVIFRMSHRFLFRLVI